MIAFHTAMGFVALLAGFFVFLLNKGTRLHKTVGWVYVLSMYLLCLTSFFIFKLFSGFGVFHVMAIVSTVTMTSGFAPVLLRKKLRGWFIGHYKGMLFSYLGLVMATNSHLFKYLQPIVGFVGAGVVLWVIPGIIGNIWINRKTKFYADKFGDVQVS
ncbi:MAG: DUF2306 domain-containing protein [Pyrinomonadaceae bacterium]